nr:MAG TPA: minor capsid protein [Caudoviricetes sp.]
MPKPDQAHQRTDKELAALERRIARVYREARGELSGTIKDYFEKFRKRDEEMKALIGTEVNGKVWTEEDYKRWRLNQIGRGERYQALREKIAERMTKANEVAIAYVNDTTPGIYSLNRNYAAYTIEKVAGNVGFDLWDEQTVKRLIVESPGLMPYYPKKKALKRGIDLKWGKQQITKSVTSGLLQGKSIGKIATDLQARVTEMNRASAVRAARTAVTGAQNGGRMDSYKAASDMGIKVRKRWVATKDGRTRHSHQKLDGQTVDWDEPFTSELGKIRYPGDPRAKPANVYNCRCTLRTVEKPGMEAEPRKMRVRDPKTGRNVVVEEMTYEQWERWVKSRG